MSGMSEQPPLCVPGAARAHLDLVVDPADRRRRTLYVVLCDPDVRPVAQAVVDDLPAAVEPATARRVVATFAAVLAHADLDGSLLLGLTRPGQDALTRADRVWADAALDVTRAAGLGLVGVYVLGPASCRVVPLATGDRQAS